MKILLLQPPIQDFYHTEIRLQPVGLGFLKAALKRHFPDLQVILKDYHSGWGRRTIPAPKELKYLQDFYPAGDRSPFCVFGPYYHFGASFAELAADVAMEKPDLVGISCLFSTYSREVLRCALEIKKNFKVKIVLGGSHISASPENMLASPYVDYVICGEGERPLVELVDAIKESADLKRVPGLGFKEGGRIVLNPRGDNYAFSNLPYPDFDDLPVDKYRYEGKAMCVVQTSRGCPYHCKFCSVHVSFEDGFRQRSPEDVFAEIQSRVEKGYRVFDFEDDNLTYDRHFIIELCRLLIGEFKSDPPQFLAMNGISYWNLDAEVLTMMRRSGFSHLNISLVSGNSRVLHDLKRPNDRTQFAAVVKIAHDLGFKIVSYQILGLPNEDLDSMIETTVFQASLPVLIGASPYYVTPGCELTTTPTTSLSSTDFMTSRLTAMSDETAYFDREDIYTLFIIIRMINFLKGISLGNERADLTEIMDGAKKEGKRSALGADLLNRVFHEGILYSAGKRGFQKNRRFKTKLFTRVWNCLENISTQEGKIIEINR